MKRRFFQFSLRGLLGLAAFVCLSLGTWHLLERYGSGLDVSDATVGQPIRVKARYFHLFGPSECILQIGYKTADGSPLSDGTFGMSGIDRVERSWLCLYSLEPELDPVDQPCQLVVYLTREEQPPDRGGGKMWTIKEKIVYVK